MSKLSFPYADTIQQALQEQYDQQMMAQQQMMQQQQQAEAAKQANPQGQLLNSIAQKIGGTKVAI
jgi:hypothetical protein